MTSTLIHPSWKPILENEFQKPYFKELSQFLTKSYTTKTIFPSKPKVFSAFATDPSNIKIVILGQDPYHTPGAAHGLAFSVQNGIVPPSLQNIYKEIQSDIGNITDTSGNLQHWAEQGVLLLNNVLTVEAHSAGSHRNKGWEQFTENITKHLNSTHPHLVFLLWGRDARAKATLIDKQKHRILESPHPSPLSAHAGFFGCKHFSQANQQLQSWHLSPVNW